MALAFIISSQSKLLSVLFFFSSLCQGLALLLQNVQGFAFFYAMSPKTITEQKSKGRKIVFT